MSVASWRATLRIARREASRSKRRTALVVTLIGLPVLALSMADIAYRTYQLDPTEKIARELGSAQAAIQWSDGRVMQGPQAWLSGFEVESPAVSSSPQLAGGQPFVDQTPTLVQHLPGRRLIATTTGTLEIKTAAGIKTALVNGMDYADPMARGLVRQVSGRAPRGDSEVALTVALAKSTGLHLGEQMVLTGLAKSFSVVGIVEDTTANHAEAAYLLPDAVASAMPHSMGRIPPTSWLVASPTPVTWSDVLALNKLGFAVLSREVYLNPPPKSQVPLIQDSSTDRTVPTTAALVVGLALLEVVLLAGPAFAVGARRQRRDLALIAANGGRRGQLRNVVLSNGIVLGAVAGVVSLVVAVTLSRLALRLFAGLPSRVPGHFDLRPDELAGLALLAVLTALLAAVFPARAAARTDVVATLAGRRGALHTSKWSVILGCALAGLGAALALGGFTSTEAGPVAILSGVGLAELGLICCTPAMLAVIAGLGRRLPLSPRIALRDAGRNRSSAAPAVAAVMASMIGAIAVTIGVVSTEDQNRRSYTAGLPLHDVFTYASAYSATDAKEVQIDPTTIAATLRSTLPVRQVMTVLQPDMSCPSVGAPTATQCSVL
ncbi:ABC-type lipoprotein release transport system permease subunit [Jatrophihabitans sp. GAS493]|uniref:FtsX-like permease family protein n=1 Tax=Jatrophihabitans sp. GAS493 TaxID=1907575 RepID=UPI000BB7C46D|nr:FtsX-like permease family protein [Jatrophihabitans sp. GAS493]SOD70710.1 ABC-type lipoprotein release transport system permease subunit [Jatrophihabitans sp. GAS493]